MKILHFALEGVEACLTAQRSEARIWLPRCLNEMPGACRLNTRFVSVSLSDCVSGWRFQVEPTIKPFTDTLPRYLRGVEKKLRGEMLCATD
jgi:hypothetical protein